MRIEGTQLVVTCRQCGLSVVAVGAEKEPIASEKKPAQSDSLYETLAAPFGGELVGGRLELEDGEDFPPSLRGHSKESKRFGREIIKLENLPLATPEIVPKVEAKAESKRFGREIKLEDLPFGGPEVVPKVEAKAQTQGAIKTQPVVPIRPKTQPVPILPKTQPKITPEIQKEILSGVVAAPRGPLKKILVVLGVLSVVAVAFFFAWPSKRAEERTIEPKRVATVPTAVPPVEPSPAPAAAAPLPATLAAAPPVEARPKALPTAAPVPPKPTLKPPKPTAPPEPPKPTPKHPLAPPASGVMSESEALSSGLVDAEVFQERAGRVMTRILLCRNLERSRDPDAALRAFDVTLVVSPSGTVSNVKLDRSVEGSHLGQCLHEQLGKLEFPKWTGGAIEIRRRVAQGAQEVSNAP
jgi:hypothetical protein